MNLAAATEFYVSAENKPKNISAKPNAVHISFLSFICCHIQ